MTTYASQKPILTRTLAQADFSQEPFDYEELEVTFRFIPEDQQVYISSAIPNTRLSLHATPKLCVWNEGDFWVWDIEIVDSYFMAWIMAHKDKLKVDLSDIVKQWLGEF